MEALADLRGVGCRARPPSGNNRGLPWLTVCQWIAYWDPRNLLKLESWPKAPGL